MATSNAATFIEFCHMDKEFNPEFTHQTFDGDVIPGYKTPTDKGKRSPLPVPSVYLK
jgi:hypothetical protein